MFQNHCKPQMSIVLSDTDKSVIKITPINNHIINIIVNILGISIKIDSNSNNKIKM